MNTVYFLKMLAGNVFGKLSTPSIPNTYYIGLSSTIPNIDGTGITEPVGGGYERLTLANNSTELTEPDGNAVVSNKKDMYFNESTASWGMMIYYVIFDAKTGGNPLMFGKLDNTRTVEPGTTIACKAGTFKLQPANPTE